MRRFLSDLQEWRYKTQTPHNDLGSTRDAFLDSTGHTSTNALLNTGLRLRKPVIILSDVNVRWQKIVPFRYKLSKSTKTSSSKILLGTAQHYRGRSVSVKGTRSWFVLERFREQQLRDSPRSPGGLSPSRSRSVWPSYPRIHLASPRRPATPQLESHSETAPIASSTWQSNAVTYVSTGTHITVYVCTCNMSTTVFTMFHWDFRPSTITVKPRALHFSLRDTERQEAVYRTRISFKHTPTFTYSVSWIRVARPDWLDPVKESLLYSFFPKICV